MAIRAHGHSCPWVSKGLTTRARGLMSTLFHSLPICVLFARSMERIGTLSYTAPEIYANRGASVVADNWSLGVVGALKVLILGDRVLTNAVYLQGNSRHGAVGK